MKRLLFGIAFIVFLSSSALANVFIDGYGAFVGTNDAKYQYGGGGALGVDLMPNIAMLYRGMYTMYMNKGQDWTKTYSHMMHMVGAEYTYRIDELQLAWRSSAMLGISVTQIKSKYEGSTPDVEGDTKKDMGLSMAFWTGIQFNATQHVSPFADMGFHYSFYSNEFDKKYIFGLHFMVGIRFYIGSNRPISED